MVKVFDYNGNVDSFIIRDNMYVSKKDGIYHLLSLDMKYKYTLKVKQIEGTNVNDFHKKILNATNTNNINVDIMLYVFTKEKKIIQLDCKKYKLKNSTTNNTVHDFSKSIKQGEEGEEIVSKFITGSKNVENLIDVRNDKQYRDKDIDYIVKYVNGTSSTIEVKTDQYESPNIFFETDSCVETNSKGCMYKTEADYIFYYFIKTGELYILNRKSFVEWVTNNIDKFDRKVFKNHRYNGKDTYTSAGRTVPKLMLEKETKLYKKIILNKE